MSNRPMLSRDIVIGHKRETVMNAVARCSFEHRGFRPCSVSVIVKSGGVARKTFYEIFENRDDCLKQTIEHAADLFVSNPLKEGGGWDALLHAVLEWMDSNKHYAWVMLVDAPAVAPSVLYRIEEEFADAIDHSISENQRIMVAGGVIRSIYGHLISEKDMFDLIELEEMVNL